MRIKIFFLFLFLFMTGLVYSSESSAFVCNIEPVKLPDWAQQFNWKGKYVGRTPAGKPVFYDDASKNIYVFKTLTAPTINTSDASADQEISPQIFKWTEQTEWRVSETKSWTQLQNEGLRSYLDSIGISCGAATNPHEVNTEVLKKVDAATLGTGKCLEPRAAVPPTGGRCCDGLAVNENTGLCDVPVLKDSSVKVCTADSECASNLGCLPQRSSDLFVHGATEEEDDPVSNLKALLIDTVNVAENTPKPVGSNCTHARECQSYSCSGSVCSDARICRYADEGEVAASQVECAPGKSLVKGSGGKCELSPEAANSTYLGLLQDAKFKPAGQCQFKVEDETLKAAVRAMESMRAMEWLLGTISREVENDCFLITPVLKAEIAGPIVAARKVVLANFSTQLAQIENDFQDLVSAKKNDYSTLEVHGQTVTSNDLATRQSSGYDTLMIMYRRNLLFQSYEKAMLEVIKHSHARTAKLSEAMAKWLEADKKWDLGGRVQEAFQCKAHWQKWTVLRFWAGWKDKYYMDVANRWTDYYEVTGKHESNASVFAKTQVLNHLQTMSGIVPDELKNIFTTKHYLLDPLMPGDEGVMKFTNYGTVKNLSKSGFLGLSKTRDLRKPRYLKGSGTGNYTAIYGDFRKRLIEFYKRYNTAESGKFPETAKFVYEPELAKTAPKDCIEKLDKKLEEGDDCVHFQTYFENLLDNAFAQFIAYSFHTDSKYTNYFRNATSWRRRLLTKYETDMANISKYYETIIKHRNIQNECIEKVTNQVVTDYMNQSEAGLKEGKSTNYYDSSGDYTKSDEAARVNVKSMLINAASRTKFSFDLSSISTKGLKNNSLMDSLGSTGSSSSSGNVGSDQSNSAMAKRLADMAAKNKKAMEKGINVDAKSSVATSARSTASTSGLASVGSAGSGQGQNAGALKTSGYKASLDEMKDTEMKMPTGQLGEDGNAAGNSAGAGAVGGMGAGRMSGFHENGQGVSGQGSSGSDSGDGGALGQNDGTGLTDAEKEKLMSSYERTKNEYKRVEEEDGLFKAVSKAYVRNLDKVLVKKKRAAVEE